MKTKIFANCRLLLVLYCSFTSIHVFAQGISSFVEGGSYPKMHVVEVEFNSQAQYNSSFTAYMDVDVWVDLSGPQGEMYRIPVFWDGGSVFRARLVGISTGNWSWNVDPNTVTNSDQGFLDGNNGKSGSFNVVVPPAGVLDENHVDYNPNFHGFIRVANNNRTLEYADGSPFFYTADTSWAILTSVFDYDNTTNTGVAGTTFQNYILDRKNQGFNGMNVISSFPNDTYTNLWATETHGKKTGPNGATPFDVQGVVDYKKINPTYWQSVDERMQFLADQGFVTLFETVRRTEQWPLLAQQDDKDSFYNYVRYLWARYGCYNMIFSWVHHDVQGGVYDDWLPLVQHAHDELSSELGNQMPYGQPRTSMSFNTSLNNWEKDIPDALDVQNVSNAERDEDMHRWLADIFYYRPNEPTQPVTVKPAFNLEPFYPGWGSHSQNEINPGLNAETMAQMQMYGSVLSGGLAGHAWGDAWHAGVAYASFVNGQPQSNALNAYESQAMGHLKSFILDEDHEYQRLKPAAETHLDNNQNYVQTLSIAVDTNNDVEFALGFFTANSSAIPNLIDLQPSKNYLFEWYNVTTGVWTSIGYMTTTSNGGLTPPSLPDTTKSWAYRIRSDDYVASTPTSGFALRINTGGAATIYNGDSYVADIHFDTGSALDRPQTGLTEPYKTFRYSTSEVMGYDIPLDNGDYTVRLHFAELWFGATGGGTGGIGSRVFDVSIEGQLAEDNLDVFGEVGAQTILVKEHQVTVTDGVLNVDFDSRDVVGGERHPIINAIEILGIIDVPPVIDAGANQTITLPTSSIQLNGSGSDPDGGAVTYLWAQSSGPSAAGFSSINIASPLVSNLQQGIYQFQLTVTDDEGSSVSDTVSIIVEPEPTTSGFALRINTGGAATTYNGDSYVADIHFDTGSALDRPQTGLTEPYKTFRYSTSEVMGYDIPLDNGDYTVRLHFAELWFGATGGGTGGTGSRVFDVSIEGQLAEDNLDVFGEVGAQTILVKEHQVTVTDGVLNVDFDSRDVVGGERHPIINAIEILGLDSDPEDAIVGHWPLNEQNGTTANDISAQGYTGTLENGLTFDTDKTGGQIGGALTFDGSNDRINLPDIDGNLQLGFSVSAWVRPSNAGGSYQGVAGSTTSGGFMMFVHQGKLGFKMTTNENGQKLVSQGTIQNNVWQKITCTFDGSEMHLYIDGTNVHNELLSGTLKNSNVGWIGWSGWGQEYFEGSVDDIKIYDQVLSDSQVSDLYLEDLQAVPDNFVGHWPLDEQNGTTANDVGGQSNNGSLVNGLSFDTDHTSGQIGGALTFDGLDDRIDLPDIDDNLQSGFSLSAWINPENTSGYQAIAGTHTSSGFMTFVHDGTLAFALQTSVSRKIVDYGVIAANLWQHIAVTYDGSTMTWFVDGIDVGSESHTGQVSDRSNGYIGWSGWSNEYFDGDIDDVRLYDSALTESQVLSLFQEGSTPANLTAKLRPLESLEVAYIHPNPTPNKFRITGISAGPKEVFVTDFSSRTLISLDTDEEEPELDLITYPAGIYIVKVLQNELEWTFKVVKE